MEDVAAYLVIGLVAIGAALFLMCTYERHSLRRAWAEQEAYKHRQAGVAERYERSRGRALRRSDCITSRILLHSRVEFNSGIYFQHDNSRAGA